jgi:hypothetical protein
MEKGLAGYWISTDKLKLDAMTDTFVGKVTELGIIEFDKTYVLWNPKTNGSSLVTFDEFDKNGDEVIGARYSSPQGYKLLIQLT